MTTCPATDHTKCREACNETIALLEQQRATFEQARATFLTVEANYNAARVKLQRKLEYLEHTHDMATLRGVERRIIHAAATLSRAKKLEFVAAARALGIDCMYDTVIDNVVELVKVS